MASIIDSLFIELGLKTDAFEKGAKKATDSLKKIDDASERTNKNLQQNTKKTGDSFESAFEALSRFGATLVSIGTVSKFVENMTQTNAQLGRTSQLLGTGVKELNAWGAAAQTTGSNSQSFLGSIQNIQSGLAKFKIGQGGQEIITTLAQLGVQAKDGKVNLLDLGDALKRVKDREGELTAKSFAERLGFDEGGYLLLTKNRNELESLISQMERLSGASEKTSDGARRLQAAWAAFSQSASGSSSELFENIFPKLEKLLNIITAINEAVRNLFKSNIGKTIVDLIFPASSTIGKALRDPQEKKSNMKSGQIIYPENQQSQDNRGQSGLTRGMRNNNPGNIEYGKFAISKGAIGTDGRFAIFPDMKSGEAAMADLLKNSYKDKGHDTISKILNRYAPGSENNTGGYINSVAKATGIDPNKKLTDEELKSVQAAMMNVESGYKKQPVGLGNGALSPLPPMGMQANPSMSAAPSTTTVSTNIQNVNVYTQAKDALGVANGMRDALSRNQLINYGVAGAK